MLKGYNFPSKALCITNLLKKLYAMVIYSTVYLKTKTKKRNRSIISKDMCLQLMNMQI